MVTDSNYRSMMEPSSGYKTVEAIDAIAAVARHIISTYIEQIALVAIILRFDNEVGRKGQGAARRNMSGSRQSTQHHRESVQEMIPELLSEEQVERYLLDNLRPLVRKTDKVFRVGHAMYFLLLGADQQGGQIVHNRLWEALLWHINSITHAQPRSPMSTCTVTIGHSAYPAPSRGIDKLIETASEAVLRFDQQPKQRKGYGVMEVSKKELHEGSFKLEDVDEDLPALARKLGIPYLTLLPSKLPADVKQLVDPKLAQELQCYPLGRERNMLTVAMLNPQDGSALERLQQATGLRIFPVLTHSEALHAALERLFC
jgi:hypothetical protein